MSGFDPNEGGRPSRLDLDRFATGELVGDERQKIQAWLAGGAARFEHLEALRRAKQAVPKLDLARVRARALALAPDADVAPAEEDAPGSIPPPSAPPAAPEAPPAPIATAETPMAVERRVTDPFADRVDANAADARTESAVPARTRFATSLLTPEPVVAVRLTSPSAEAAPRGGPGMPRNASVPSGRVEPGAANGPWWFAVPLGLAAAVALLVGVGQLTATDPATDVGGGVVFRAGDRLAAFVVHGDARVGYDGRPLGAGDVLAFQLVPGKATGAVLLSIDATGAVTVFEPTAGDAPAPIAPSDVPVALPATIVLDGAPGPEVFVAGFDQPVPFVRDGAAAAWRSGGAPAVAQWAETIGGDSVVVNRK